jgi:hypothetical protein
MVASGCFVAAANVGVIVLCVTAGVVASDFCVAAANVGDIVLCYNSLIKLGLLFSLFGGGCGGAVPAPAMVLVAHRANVSPPFV